MAIVKKSKKQITLEHIRYNKEGYSHFFEIHGRPICDENGNVVRMIEYSLDVTDRKKTEEALQIAHDNLEKRVRERTVEISINKSCVRSRPNSQLQKNANGAKSRLTCTTASDKRLP